MMLSERLTIKIQVGDGPAIKLEIDPRQQSPNVRRLIQFANQATEDLPVFAKTAQCPACGGYDTRVGCNEVPWRTRYHYCRSKGCLHRWKSLQAELTTAAEQAASDLPVHAVSLQCPACKSWKTAAMRNRQRHGTRKHICREPTCTHEFVSRMAEIPTASTCRRGVAEKDRDRYDRSEGHKCGKSFEVIRQSDSG